MSNQQQENLNTLANILQLFNTLLLQQDVSNNDMMRRLEEQNKTIIDKLDEILKLLKR